MATSDPIADMLTRIRNADRIGKRRVRVKRSKVCLGIAQVLKDEGYILDFQQIEDTNQGEIEIDLKYADDGTHVIQDLQRVSRPGRRIYAHVDEMPRVLDGLGITIVSTSRGVLSDRQCRKQRVGGELLCKVW
ncbi:MAG: 30S ribosomal protein S8 [Phycisphaerae bacterium]|jgi:small subunit ribosomal protein S8|nr:30S ribosomal protein S8 [Phycisphaerae bacterium]HOO17526.1 30S ribosomal protein S8 [Phycisphaerae bacterium]HPC22086.1 30S ribosomal protein S8 [Phycisphaerae bacterium]HRS27079.1 30S ribosomal protein S8 [Phycisphaerae bacterium]HRT40688.1 30S ribosomal protein S8 [Phycisphaerae bacterium]